MGFSWRNRWMSCAVAHLQYFNPKTTHNVHSSELTIHLSGGFHRKEVETLKAQQASRKSILCALQIYYLLLNGASTAQKQTGNRSWDRVSPANGPLLLLRFYRRCLRSPRTETVPPLNRTQQVNQVVLFRSLALSRVKDFR